MNVTLQNKVSCVDLSTSFFFLGGGGLEKVSIPYSEIEKSLSLKNPGGNLKVPQN